MLSLTPSQQVLHTHVTVEDEKFEIINAMSQGNCFYQAIRIGLSFHNIFATFQQIKQAILKRERDLFRNKEPWFKTAFEHETYIGAPFAEYEQKVSENNAWGGTLERLVACDLYNIDLQMLYPRSGHDHVFMSSRKEMEEHNNYRVTQPRFTLHLCFVNISAFYSTNPNHFKFLRPMNLNLTIADNFPKNTAYRHILSLMDVARPVFQELSEEQEAQLGFESPEALARRLNEANRIRMFGTDEEKARAQADVVTDPSQNDQNRRTVNNRKRQQPPPPENGNRNPNANKQPRRAQNRCISNQSQNNNNTSPTVADDNHRMHQLQTAHLRLDSID